jgi:cell division protein FtsW
MIFSIICEELGLFGALAIICVFLVLIYRILIIAVNAPDLFGSLIAIGVAVHLSVQTLINIGVVTNFFPPTGIPLPFISYGGSSLMALLIEMGLVLSISRQIRA